MNEALSSEAFINNNYLSFYDLVKLRQVNRQLHQSSRIKKKIQARGMIWLQSKIPLSDTTNPKEVMEKIRRIIFNSLIGYDSDDPNKLNKLVISKESDVKELHSYYVFLGGKASYDFILNKAGKQIGALHPAPILLSGALPGASVFTLVLTLSIFTAIPPVGIVFIAFATALAIAIIAMVIFTTLVEHNKKQNHYADIEKRDEPNPIPVFPARKKNFSNCLRNLFFKPEIPRVSAIMEPSDHSSLERK